jgi:3,4-dihydroxy 2-butanone 4-phosphate synthase / GTP cyclohydrolase II
MTVNQRMMDVLDAFKKGEIVVVTDDDDRENEGDLIVAASLCTPEKMAFIVRHTSGIVCAPLTVADARRLRLDPMVAVNDAPHTTAFTVSVDVRHGTTTGISAEERTNTVRALANTNVGAVDFVRPGHIFPLVAREGGVLIRSGHTEAAVDLCRLTGLPEVGVISELVNDDGSVMRGSQVADFADTHNLRQVSVADLIAYRQAREKLIERVASFALDTSIGPVQAHAFQTPFDAVQHLALVYGDVSSGRKIPTRLHRADAVTDVFGGGHMIARSLDWFKQNGAGVLVYLRDGVVGVPAAPMPDVTSDEARSRLWREVGVGAQILRDLGVSSIRLLASRERHYVGLEGFGIGIDETVIVDGAE